MDARNEQNFEHLAFWTKKTESHSFGQKWPKVKKLSNSSQKILLPSSPILLWHQQ